MGVLLLAAAQMGAAPIAYEGTLTGLGSIGTGTVVASGNKNCGLCGHGIGEETLDFWRISITAPILVTIRGTRLDPNLDLAFVLYWGDPFDVTPRDMSLRNGQRIWQDGSSLVLEILLSDLLLPGVGDDEIDRAPFPYGDPEVTFFLDPGIYTLAVSGGIGSGIVSTAAANYRIELADPTGLAVVDTPEPSSYLLLCTGFASLACVARRLRPPN